MLKNKLINSTRLSSHILYWSFFLIVLFYFLEIVLPKKGINWSDVGLYYAIANNYLFGQFNEYGLAGLFNAILIKAHFNYLNLSRFFNLLQFFSGLLFVISLRMQKKFYFIAPIGVMLCISTNAIEILSYETAGTVFLLLAIALLFITINYSLSRFWQNFCYVASAFFFCYSSVTNLILVPSLFINGIILFFIYPRIRNKIFIMAYALFAFTGLYLIIFKVFPLFKLSYFYDMPVSPDSVFSLHAYITRALMYFSWPIGLFCLGFSIAKIITFILKKFEKFTGFNIHAMTITLVLMTIISWFGIDNIALSNNFFSYNNNLLIHSLIYFGGMIAIYDWQFYKDQTSLLLTAALLLVLEYYLALTVAIPIPWAIRTFVVASQVTLIIFMWLEFFWKKPGEKLWGKISVTLILLFAMFYSLQQEKYYAFGQIPWANNQKITHIDRLNGMYTDADMLASLQRVIAVYQQYHCANKLFIVRARSPLFYYIFNRPAQEPIFFYNTSADLDKLVKAKATTGYCYFGDQLFDIAMRQNSSTIKIKGAQGLYHWLQINSRKIIYIPTGCVGCIRGFFKVFIG